MRKYFFFKYNPSFTYWRPLPYQLEKHQFSIEIKKDSSLEKELNNYVWQHKDIVKDYLHEKEVLLKR